MASKIDILKKEYYLSKDLNGTNIRTRQRLAQLIKMGFEVMSIDIFSIHEFGITDVVSGLSIEYIWNLSEKQWTDYISWVEIQEGYLYLKMIHSLS